MDRAHLDWPFFDTEHRALASGLDAWCAELPAIVGTADGRNVDDAHRGFFDTPARQMAWPTRHQRNAHRFFVEVEAMREPTVVA